MKYLHQNETRELRKILAQNGHERTKDLVSILDVFLSSESHQSIDELHGRLKEAGFDFDRELVENALETFCHYGFAQVKVFQDGANLYEHKHLGQHHDHLVCTRCGRIEEFVNPIIEKLQVLAAHEKGFVPLEHRLDIYGLCEECARQRGDALPLCHAEKGEKMKICGHIGGGDLQRRLSDMGLNSGAEVEVLSNGSGPVIVACKGCRLALGRGMSEKVMVEPACEHALGRRRRRKKSPWHGRKHKRFFGFDSPWGKPWK